MKPLANGAMSLSALAVHFGAAAVTGIAIEHHVEIHGRRVRFEASHVEGKTFEGRLTSDGDELWADRFTLDDFPGLDSFIASCLSGAE